MKLKVKIELEGVTCYHSTHPFYESGKQWLADILNVSAGSRAIGEEKGYEASSVDITFDDINGDWRLLMIGESQYILRKPATIYDENDNIIFSGVIDDWKFGLGTFSLTIKDRLLGLKNTLNSESITKTDYSDAPDAALGAIKPIIAGYVRSDYGAIKAWRITAASATPTKFIVSQHHCKSIEAAFTANKISISGTIENNADGHCYFLVTAGSAEEYILVNVKGMIDESSTLIEDPTAALAKIIDDYTELEYDAPSFTAVQGLMQGRGYIIGGAVVNDLTVEEFLSEFCNAFDCDFFMSRSKKLTLTMLDWININVAAAFDENIIINFILEVYPLTIRNKVRYMYKYNYAEDYYQLQPIFTKTTSITRWGEFYGTLNLRQTSDEATAYDVVQRYTVSKRNPYRKAIVTLPIDQVLPLELGNIVSLKHPAAIQNEFRRYQILGVEENYLENWAKITCIDMTQLREYGAFKLGDRDTMHNKWTDATEAERVYGYLADRESGLFSNGDQGKSL